jgi:AraC-like DNA-binding protein
MQVSKFVESYFDAWNHRDARGVADHLADDGVYCDVPLNFQGTHDDLVAFLENFFANDPQRYQLIGDVLSNGNSLAFQYKIIPGSDNRSSGETYSGAEFMTLDGEAAVTITDYYELGVRQRNADIANVNRGGDTLRKYAKSGLSTRQLQAYKRHLEHVMKTDQVFLQSDLTLPKLAEAVGCSVNHLSQVINAGFGMSFFDYLNRYRIDHARTLLTQREGHSGAILNIAFSVGFNSNSAFYAAFKKCVGQTPAQYRRAQLRRRH